MGQDWLKHTMTMMSGEDKRAVLVFVQQCHTRCQNQVNEVLRTESPLVSARRSRSSPSDSTLPLPVEGRKQWRHGAMVGGGETADWTVVLLGGRNELSAVSTSAHHPLMMAWIYKVTHKHAHKQYIQCVCTHAPTHVCMCPDGIWARPH